MQMVDSLHRLRMVAFATIALIASPVGAAKVSLLVDVNAIAVDGAIDPGDFHLIENLFAANPGIDRLYLNSPGGDFLTAIEIGEWAHTHGLATYASGSMCMSACAFLWLGGKKRYANGLVYLHMPFYRTSTVTVAVPIEGAVRAAWYLARIGADRALLDALLVIGSTEDNQMFPITGPNTALYSIAYDKFRDEGRYKEALSNNRKPAASPD